MIKTLRITSIIAAIAATGLLVLPAVYGVRSNPKIEELLKSPGVVEKFTSAKGQQTSKDQSQNSPLVKEAVAIGTYFNPPPPPKPAPSAQPSGPSQPVPPAPVAVKFDLIATSYFASHPEQSFVLIDEPGKGQHWVKQGTTIGHLTIETVKDGSIVLREGQKTSEMTVKVQESWRKLLKNPPPSTRSSSEEEPVAASPAVQTPASPKGPENAARPSPVTTNRPAGIIGPPNSRRNPRQGATPPASERITSPNQPPPAIGQPKPAETVKTPPASEVSQPPTPPVLSTPPAAQPQPEEVPKTAPAPEIAQPPPQPEIPDSPAVKEKAAQIDKLISEMNSSSDEKETDELFKQIEELGGMREAESPKDANAKDVNK
ncbi:MAG: hypothetical protein WBL85_03970 [Sedimentisphaerales bacterium]